MIYRGECLQDYYDNYLRKIFPGQKIVMDNNGKYFVTENGFLADPVTRRIFEPEDVLLGKWGAEDSIPSRR